MPQNLESARSKAWHPEAVLTFGDNERHPVVTLTSAVMGLFFCQGLHPSVWLIERGRSCSTAAAAVSCRRCLQSAMVQWVTNELNGGCQSSGGSASVHVCMHAC